MYNTLPKLEIEKMILTMIVMVFGSLMFVHVLLSNTEKLTKDIMAIASIEAAAEEAKPKIDKYLAVDSAASKSYEKNIQSLQVVKIAKYIEVNYDVNQTDAIQIAHAHTDAAKKYNIPIDIGLSINHKESSFKKNVISYNDTSYGLMQINFNVWKRKYKLNEQNVFDIKNNIDVGYNILHLNYIDSNKNMVNALAMYYGSTDRSKNIQYAYDVLNNATKFKRI